MFTTTLLASILLLAFASPAPQQSPVPRGTGARSHPPAAQSPASSRQDDLQQDLKIMRSLLDRMQANLVFVGAGPTPLRRQFELEIEMWRALIDHMERAARGPQPAQAP